MRYASRDRRGVTFSNPLTQTYEVESFKSYNYQAYLPQKYMAVVNKRMLLEEGGHTNSFEELRLELVQHRF